MVQRRAQLYAQLGVRPTASQKEIRNAFHRLAVELHPDRNDSTAAQQRFVVASRAYDVLGNPDRRRAYDLQLRKEQERRRRQSRAHAWRRSYRRRRESVIVWYEEQALLAHRSRRRSARRLRRLARQAHTTQWRGARVTGSILVMLLILLPSLVVR